MLGQVTRRRSSAAVRIARQASEMSVAVPAVVAHRMARLAAAGASPSARDRHEFTTMGTEKALAFWQSWAAMWLQAANLQISFMQGMALASMGLARPRGASARTLSAATARVLAAGLAPVHAAAVANAKRLARVRR